MADRGGLLTLEDQGTIGMFSLLLALVAGTVLYFACTWYWKKKPAKLKQPSKSCSTKDNKPAVSKTFSRFSQVDEELTVHMGALDVDDVDDDDDGVDACAHDHAQTDACADGNEKTETLNTNTSTDTASTILDRPPYLETDM